MPSGTPLAAELIAPVMSIPATTGSATGPVETAATSLTRRLVQGDEAAWAEFHAAYSPRLERYLLVVCRGNEEAVHEVLQLTFLRAVRHMRVFPTEEQLWNWLALLARSAATDVGRRQRRYQGFLDRWFRAQPAPAPTPAPQEVEDRLESLLQRELARLPAEERSLLEQKYLEGDSVRQLAESMGTTEKAVESRLTRARQRLRQALFEKLRHENDAD